MADAALIVPGCSVGFVRLGEPAATVGPRQQAGRSPGWLTVTTKNGQTIQFLAVPSQEHGPPLVQEIRITSPAFHTAEGLQVGRLAPTIGFRPAGQSAGAEMDNVKQGIAIVVSHGKITAIVVHSKNHSVGQVSAPMIKKQVVVPTYAAR